MDRSASTARLPREQATVAEAVLFATAPADGGSAAALLEFGDATILDRLLAQLRGLGVAPVHVVGRPADQHALQAVVDRAAGRVLLHLSLTPAADLQVLGDLAGATERPLVVAPAEIVCHRSALERVIADERLRTGILRGPRAGGGYDVRSLRGRVLSAGSPHHVVGRPTAAFLGLLKLDRRDRLALQETVDRLVAWLAADYYLRDRVVLAHDDVTALLLVGLVRGGVRVGERDVRGLFWARPRSSAAADDAHTRLAGADERRALLDAAVKSRDGFFTTFFVSPYSKYLARGAARLGLTPNQITVASLVVGVLAAAGFATGQRWGLVAG